MYKHMNTIPYKTMYNMKGGHHKYYNLHLLTSVLLNSSAGMLQKQTLQSIDNNMYN
jgi:hypothetical protein